MVFKNQKIRLCVLTLWVISALSPNAGAAPQTVLLGGEVVGIQLNTQGPVITAVEKQTPAERAGLQVGDVIIAYNQTAVHTAQRLSEQIQSGERFSLSVLHNGKMAEHWIAPMQTPEKYLLGVRVRDCVSGIGTVTFVQPESGTFGALGHGVVDGASGKLLPICSGFLVPAEVAEVRQGEKGNPGQLIGAYDVKCKIGAVSKNSAEGIFGTMHTGKRPSVAVGKTQDVHTGTAYLYCTVTGAAPQLYEAQILGVNPGAENGRDLMLRVTDEELLRRTGGIVQGMSGSPVLQDGKLIGAVTHVLLSDPQKGYGILLERMLKAA